MERVASSILKSKVVSRSTSGIKKVITLEAANLAKFADGACTCSLGDTSVLVTAVCDRQQKPPSRSSFLPLTVDYKQKAAAAGRIPMTHLRRDVGVTEKEILTSRVIDRSIRPCFSKGFYNDTQIICNLLAVDGSNDPDVLAINGASASLTISDIPWNGPVGSVRLGLIGENIVVNPTRREQEDSRLNLILTANSLGNIMMIDGSCREPIALTDVQKAIKQGVKECVAIVETIKELQKIIGKPKRILDLTPYLPTQEHKKLVESLCKVQIKNIMSNYSHDKISRGTAMSEIETEANLKFKESFPDCESSIFDQCFSQLIRDTYYHLLTETKTRCDGRKLDQLRPISCKVDLFKPLHGSAMFQRGQTQVLCSTTFDSPDATFRTDSITALLSGVKEKNFMLHYEFPPFATNEVGRIATMPGRREIGHGALAEKALRPVIPEQHDMTIRLNCEVLESNGSSSMASVCAGSMSLMDAGVKVKEAVAGVAIGLITDKEDSATKTKDAQHHLLIDILGLEDFIGDMDFKIAGTKKAITALQLDVKPMTGLPPTLIHKALHKAHSARCEIINLMEKSIKEPRQEKKDNHPVIKTIHIPPHKKAKFIGFGGANIRKLTAAIGVRISACDTVNDEVTGDIIGATAQDNFTIFAPNKDAMEEAEEYIKNLLEKEYREPELEFNGIYTATIQEVREKGVMVTLYPNMIPALLSNSQLDVRTIKHPSALNLEVGQQIQVKYFGRDPATGHMRLSRKSLLMSAR